jgi:D-3-phosphoglycerate dehydrogenase / 2-oxoglutarate reductase
MPRVAVTTPYFDFFPELKAEIAAKYPGTKIPHRPQTARGG